jgi:S-formylglutathione hydrolase FrmB
MMIGGEFNTPADWMRAGNAIKTADDFASSHGGNAPVLVFVDSGGAFNNDTECVNGTRGNAADHLTEDVPRFMEATYGVSANPAKWGIVGWSMGGTCAVDLAVMHPDEFSTFEDIAGDIAPNSGNKQQTIQRLFGGNAAAYATFDPTSVMHQHDRYSGVSGWFAISGTASVTNAPTTVNAANSGGNGMGGRDPARHTSDQTSAATSLCGTGATKGIACAVVAQPGKHDWPFAARAFVAALPWLAGQLGTPGVPAEPLPASEPPAPTVEAAGR